MATNQTILLKLLNCAIRKEKPVNIDFKAVNWTCLVEELRHHEIYPLLYPVIREMSHPDSISFDLREKWKRNTFSTVIYLNNQIAQAANVFKEFNNKNIPVIALKGLILREYYPVPDLRTMGDADILVQKKDINKTKALLTQMGYAQTKETTPAHITFVHKSYSPIEVHWALTDTRYINSASQFEKDIWQNAVSKEFGDTYVMTLCPEDFLVHLCIHMAVHMRSGGFGLRQLCDLVLFAEGEDIKISWDVFELKIKLTGIEKFTTAIFYVCKRIFDMQISGQFPKASINSKYIDMLVDDIFESGVFGMKSLDRVFGNNLLNARIVFGNENISRMNNVFKIICPPVNTLSEAYSYAKKYKILTPIAWIHHFFAGLINEKYSILDKLKFFFLSTFTFKKRSKLIKKLEL